MRLENWESTLAGEIEKAEQEPFVWGVNDCCLWTADVVLAITGEDYALEFRDLYNTKKGAYEALGIKTVEETINHKLGKQAPLNMLQRGDVVMGIFENQQTLGICIGARVAFKTPTGLIQVPVRLCVTGWKVR